MIILTQHSLALLPTQLRLNGTFSHSAVDSTTRVKVPFRLETEQQPTAIRVTVRMLGFTGTLTICRSQRDAVDLVHAFIVDLANGQPQEAA